MNALQFTSIDIKILIFFITSKWVEKVLFNQQSYSAAKIVRDHSRTENQAFCCESWHGEQVTFGIQTYISLIGIVWYKRR